MKHQRMLWRWSQELCFSCKLQIESIDLRETFLSCSHHQSDIKFLLKVFGPQLTGEIYLSVLIKQYLEHHLRTSLPFMSCHSFASKKILALIDSSKLSAPLPDMRSLMFLSLFEAMWPEKNLWSG